DVLRREHRSDRHRLHAHCRHRRGLGHQREHPVQHHGAVMRCPRCTLTELSEATETCWLCGYASETVAVEEAPPAEPSELDARRELAHDFRIESLLERPPGPIVYLARDAEERPLALKVVPRAQVGPAEDRFPGAAHDGGRAGGPAAGADQRALAAIAHQCLTGIAMGEDPPTADDGPSGLPLHVSQALRRALSSRQADRFPSVLDFVAALGGTRPDARTAWFGANPRKKGAGSPVVIVD